LTLAKVKVSVGCTTKTWFCYCSCDDEVFRVDPETLEHQLDTVDERDEDEAFTPEKPTQEKWNELLAIVRRAEVLRFYINGLYGSTGGGTSSFFAELLCQLRHLVWMVIVEEVHSESSIMQMCNQEDGDSSIIRLCNQKDSGFYSFNQHKMDVVL
jgi:hypothetical protein